MVVVVAVVGVVVVVIVVFSHEFGSSTESRDQEFADGLGCDNGPAGRSGRVMGHDW